jgi:hypothetical protein
MERVCFVGGLGRRGSRSTGKGMREARLAEYLSWAFGNTGTRFKVFVQPGVPPTPGRRPTTRPRSTASPAWPPVWRCTFPGTRRTTTWPWPSTRTSAGSGSAPSTPTSSRTTTTSWAASAIPTRGSARGPWPTCWTALTSWTPPGRVTSSCGSPTAPTTRPGRHRGPAGPAGRGTADGLRAARRAPADAPGVQAVRAVVLHRRRARLGHVAAALHGAGAEGGGRGRYRASRPGHQHRVHRGRAATGGRLGGFDFNSRFYADDDLMVGAAGPFQLFRIMHEVVKAGALRPAAGVAFMLDQCHNIEPKIPARRRSCWAAGHDGRRAARARASRGRRSRRRRRRTGTARR